LEDGKVVAVEMDLDEGQIGKGVTFEWVPRNGLTGWALKVLYFELNMLPVRTR
jgi:hypothetical protein